MYPRLTAERRLGGQKIRLSKGFSPRKCDAAPSGVIKQLVSQKLLKYVFRLHLPSNPGLRLCRADLDAPAAVCTPLSPAETISLYSQRL